MENNKVSVEDSETTEMPYKNNGRYEESLIINGTSKNIYIIGTDNARQIIEPDPFAQFSGITIIRRYINGVRFTRDTEGRVLPIPCTTKTYKIPATFIDRGHYLHKHLNILFASETIGATLKHPNANKSYDDMILEITNNISGKASTDIKFIINDPNNRIDKVYGCIGEHCFIIPCTSIRTKGLSNLKVIIGTKDNTSIHADEEIEELFSSGSYSSTAFDKLFTLGKTPDEALARYASELRSSQQEIEDHIATRLAELKKADSTDVSEELSKLKITNDKQSIELLEQKNLLRQQFNELESKDKLLKQWETTRDYIDKNNKREMASKLSNDKLVEQEHKTARARWSASGEASKIIVNAVVLIIGAVAGAIIKAIASGGD